MTSKPGFESVVIANAASVSDVHDLGGLVPVGLFIPAAWTAASITFLVSPDGTTYYDMFDAAGTEYAVIVAVDRFIVLDPTAFSGIPFMKIRSGTKATPVNQGAARTIQLCLRDVG